ncbi:MAG: RNA polymerase sporulation sigma factor SigG [Eubacteriales bacterium]|nr:RNA polymerase sporulation sigma factor SigG [Eubacteriales bacterium]
MYNKVEICGVNTSKLVTISESEKRELLKKSREGDKKAREKLINGNLKLVLSVLQSFTSRGACPDDLFQVGCIGLIKAVDNFDLSQDVRFSTYAVPMIIGEVRRYLRDDNHIRVSRSVRDTAYKALQVKDRLSKSLSREPTPQEISKELGISQREVTAAMDAIMEPVSLYEPVYSENGDSLYVMDQISDKNNNDENWITNIAITEAIKKLTDREKRILTLRFYSGKTQTEVSAEIGISQAQVSRLEKTALEKIREEL